MAPKCHNVHFRSYLEWTVQRKEFELKYKSMFQELRLASKPRCDEIMSIERFIDAIARAIAREHLRQNREKKSRAKRKGQTK
jgi:hypothetical protein